VEATKTEVLHGTILHADYFYVIYEHLLKLYNYKQEDKSISVAIFLAFC
jgi:hypothetical protein